MIAERRQPEHPFGFSLIEMLVVVVILLILFTIYWGSGSANRQQKLQARCRNNLQKLYLALEIYANEHAVKFPAVTGARTAEEPLDLLVPRYTVDTSLFICPGSDDSPLPAGESLLPHKISYAYYMGSSSTNAGQALMSDRQVDALSKTTGQLLFSTTGRPPGNNHDKLGGNILFGDAHCEQSAAHASFAVPVAPGVVLLNPK